MNSILSLGSLCQSESAHRGAEGVPLAAFTPGPASISPKAVAGMGILSSPPPVSVSAKAVISHRYLCQVVDGATSDANAVRKLTAMIDQL